MAKWQIEQKTEVWYQTIVEADTFEEAILKADETGDWERGEYTEFTDNYWGMNLDTEEQYTNYEGNIRQEV